MNPFLHDLWKAVYIGTGFLWTAAWAIFLGLMITSWVQVYVSKEKLAEYMGKEGLTDLSWSTFFGALSSGCSFGATVIGKGLFKKGAHPMNVLAFMFASTNLIVELGLMIWILMGWEFLLAELLGGVFLIGIMAVLVHFTLPGDLFERVRQEILEQEKAADLEEDPACGMEGSAAYTLNEDGVKRQFCSAGCRETYEQQRAGRGSGWDQLFAWGTWFRLGHRYFMEWSMIWKDVVAGFLIAGFVIVFVPQWVWNALFLQGEGVLASLENAFMGVTIAVISFVGSIGNVPFAVALWGGGVSFAGVIAFVYSDLITVPVLNVYRKYYGWPVMLYILGVFFVTMALSGFAMEELFGALGIVPSIAEGPSVFEKDFFRLDFTFAMNMIVFGMSGFLYYAREKGRHAGGEDRDPICGMRSEDRDLSVEYGGERHYFCSAGCRDTFLERPEKYLDAHGEEGANAHSH